MRETIFGARHGVRYFEVTTDPVHLPRETTWGLMTNLPGKIERTVGNTFGLRTWIEYGFKQAKDEVGWADYRLTDAASIERWWELVMCAYLLVSLQAPVFAAASAAKNRRADVVRLPLPLTSGLDRGCELETPPQQLPAPAATLRLCLPPAALAAPLSPAAPRRPVLPTSVRS